MLYLFITGAKAEMVDNLRELGIKVVVVKGPKSIADVKENVKLIAKL